MQDFSAQPGFAAVLGLVPLALLGVVFVFALVGTRATHRVIRVTFKLLAWGAGLALGVGLIVSIGLARL